MNTWRCSTVVCALLTGMAISSACAETITAEGVVYAAPCTLEAGLTQTIDLGRDKIQALNVAGSESRPQPFVIRFDKCPASSSKVNIKFDGVADPGDATVFKNAGTAIGLGVRIYPKDQQTPVSPGATQSARITNAQAELAFLATIYSSAGNAQAGSIDVTVPIVLSYE
ncbi:fimbrial protein [Collimonas silvisoli]|uniref:fimbrial protein n=1 Tax=Collimonas silvisoli TaxID=2825884 RepID=UPI001B8ACBD9|nr:fimbrial protein [Collimonas silvisoli]